MVCMHKLSPFPIVKNFKAKSRKKGPICKICDRKLFMYNTFREYAVEGEQQEALLKNNNEIYMEKMKKLR